MASMEDLQYGPVMITRGKHKGTIGYYDDTNGRSALVFLGPPFISPWIWMRYESLEPLKNISSLEIERFRKTNPEVCAIMGV
jgi:hypothetical protein